MKRFLRIYALLFLCMIGLTAYAETWKHTFVSGDLTTSAGDITLTEKTWTQSSATYVNYVNTTNGFQIGSAKNPALSFTLSSKDFNEEITSVTVNSAIASSGDTSIGVTVGGTTFTCDGNPTASPTTTATKYTFTGSATGEIVITFTNTKKAFYLESITVEYGVSVAAPTFSPAGGTYTEAQSVTLSQADGATIYYSTDGETFNEYSEAINVSSTTTIYAYAKDTDGNPSTTVSATYTIQPAAPTLSLEAGTYTEAQSVTITAADGLTIYYSTDGEKYSEYTSAIDISETTTLYAYAQDANGNKSEIVSAKYTFKTGSNLYTKVTSADQIAAGNSYIFVSDDGNAALGAITSGTGGSSVTVSIDQDANGVNTVDIDGLDVTEYTLDGETDAWTFYDGSKYMTLTKKNSLATTTTSSSATWTINSDYTVSFTLSSTTYTLRYNSSAGTPFRCYSTTTGNNVYLYVQGGVSIATPTISPDEASFLTTKTVTITADDGLTIYYSTDGENFDQYSGELTLDATTTVYAYAQDASGNKSTTVHKNYTKLAVIELPHYENFADSLGDFTTDPNNTSTCYWHIKQNTSDEDIAKYGEVRKYAYISGYEGKGYDRLVSPVFDGTTEGLKTINLNFIHAGHWFNNANSSTADNSDEAAAEIKKRCQVMVREVSADGTFGEWVTMEYPNVFEQNISNSVAHYDHKNSGDISLDDYIGKYFQISFYYHYDDESVGTGTWNILKVVLNTGDKEKVQANGFLTYVVENDIDAKTTRVYTEGDDTAYLRMFKVTTFDGKTVVLQELGLDDNADSEQYLPAETPILIKTEGCTDDEGNISLTVLQDYDSVLPTVKNNKLKPSYGDVVGSSDDPISVLNRTAKEGSGFAYLTVNGTCYQYGFYRLKAGKTLANRRAYLLESEKETTTTAKPDAAKGIYVLGDPDTTTGISELQNDSQKANVFYNLQGIRVDNPSKGIYIVNGKKVIIK